jgi:hypothetical protein
MNQAMNTKQKQKMGMKIFRLGGLKAIHQLNGKDI